MNNDCVTCDARPADQYCGECPVWLSDSEMSERDRMIFEAGKEAGHKEVLDLVHWESIASLPKHKVYFSIDFNNGLYPEQIGKIIEQQLKELPKR